MTDQELRQWALDQYGSEALADDLELVRRLHEDDEFVAANGNVPRDADDEIPYDRFMAELDDLRERASTRHAAVRSQRRQGL